MYSWGRCHCSARRKPRGCATGPPRVTIPPSAMPSAASTSDTALGDCNNDTPQSCATLSATAPHRRPPLPPEPIKPDPPPPPDGPHSRRPPLHTACQRKQHPRRQRRPRPQPSKRQQPRRRQWWFRGLRRRPRRFGSLRRRHSRFGGRRRRQLKRRRFWRCRLWLGRLWRRQSQLHKLRPRQLKSRKPWLRHTRPRACGLAPVAYRRRAGSGFPGTASAFACPGDRFTARTATRRLRASGTDGTARPARAGVRQLAGGEGQTEPTQFRRSPALPHGRRDQHPIPSRPWRLRGGCGWEIHEFLWSRQDGGCGDTRRRPTPRAARGSPCCGRARQTQQSL